MIEQLTLQHMIENLDQRHGKKEVDAQESALNNFKELLAGERQSWLLVL
jgi:hypothetical protein